MSKPKFQLIDTLVISDYSSGLRLVAKTFRIGGRVSYSTADSLATEAGWEGEPSGQRSSRVRTSRKEFGGDWVLTIEFTSNR